MPIIINIRRHLLKIGRRSVHRLESSSIFYGLFLYIIIFLSSLDSSNNFYDLENTFIAIGFFQEIINLWWNCYPKDEWKWSPRLSVHNLHLLNSFPINSHLSFIFYVDSLSLSLSSSNSLFFFLIFLIFENYYLSFDS